MKYPLILTLATVLLTACNTTPAPTSNNTNTGGNNGGGEISPPAPVAEYLNPSGEWKLDLGGMTGLAAEKANLIIRDAEGLGKWSWSPKSTEPEAKISVVHIEGTYDKKATYPYNGKMTYSFDFPDGFGLEPSDVGAMPMPGTEKCDVLFEGEKVQHSAQIKIDGQFLQGDNGEVQYKGTAILSFCKNGNFEPVPSQDNAKKVPVTAIKL